MSDSIPSLGVWSGTAASACPKDHVSAGGAISCSASTSGTNPSSSGSSPTAASISRSTCFSSSAFSARSVSSLDMTMVSCRGLSVLVKAVSAS